MNDEPRVAVYIDFDNVVISRYDNVHGDGAWRQDNARHHQASANSADPIDVRLAEAQVDLGAVIDYASSFGTVALTRAYADWSVAANAAYKRQLIDKAVDLVQLFTTSGVKNGADIRLAVDAVEDLIAHQDLSHVVVVAGDSDYVPLAQRCKRLGRYVVGIGVAGSTSTALVAACDEFTDYARLPGVPPVVTSVPVQASAKKAAAKSVTKKAAAAQTAATENAPAAKTAAKKTVKKAATKKAAAVEPPEQAQATALLVRAMRVRLESADDEWIHSSSVKSQMQRMDPGFKEKALGYSSFRAFVESRHELVDSQVHDNGQLLVRLR